MEDLSWNSKTGDRAVYYPYTLIRTPRVFSEAAEIQTLHPLDLPEAIAVVSNEWIWTGASWSMDGGGSIDGNPYYSIPGFRMRLKEYAEKYPDHGFILSGVGPMMTYVTAWCRLETYHLMRQEDR